MWHVGETHNIAWRTTGNIQTVNISISSGVIGTVQIASNVPASNGYYSWTVPSNVTSGGYVYINISSGSVVGYSQSFNIAP
jgi:hypothetical protein